MDTRQTDWRGPHDRANRDELVERLMRATGGDGVVEPVPGIVLGRTSEPTGLLHGVLEPALCVIAQGAKEVMLGGECYRYDANHYLLATVGLPTVSHVVQASPEQPYLSMRLSLDRALVSSVLVEVGQVAPRGGSGAKAMNVSELSFELLDAVLRRLRLLDTPDAERVLAPLVVREIVYRLVVGEQGERLRHLASGGGHGQRIASAVERLRDAYDQPLQIDDLARGLGMSTSSFHAHFKAVTAMSPLQFQKHLRLQEARRLMLSEGLDAAGAGYRVGYEDASHFSREYKRLFGEPPQRDVSRLREAVLTT
mgnify:CR=1 FL=1